jgi:hypothetical protein
MSNFGSPPAEPEVYPGLISDAKKKIQIAIRKAL